MLHFIPSHINWYIIYYMTLIQNPKQMQTLSGRRFMSNSHDTSDIRELSYDHRKIENYIHVTILVLTSISLSLIEQFSD